MTTKVNPDEYIDSLLMAQREEIFRDIAESVLPPRNWPEFVQIIVGNELEKARALVDAEPRLVRFVAPSFTIVGDQLDRCYDTALGSAAVNNRPEMIRLFVQRGADPSLVPSNHPQSYPLYRALRNGPDAAKALIEAGANMEVRIPQERRKTLFALAISDGQFEIAMLMLKKRANVASKDVNGETPFQTALVSRHPTVTPLIERLVEAGADDSTLLTDEALNSLKSNHFGPDGFDLILDIYDSERREQFKANVQAAKAAFAKRLSAIRELCAPFVQMPTKHVIEYLA